MKLNADKVFWPIVHAVAEQIDKRRLNQKEAYEEIKLQIAKLFKEEARHYDLGSRYSYQAKIYRFPALGMLEPRIREDLKKAREIGWGVNRCLLIARGKETFNELVSANRKTGTQVAAAKGGDAFRLKLLDLLEEIERFQRSLAGLKTKVERMVK